MITRESLEKKFDEEAFFLSTKKAAELLGISKGSVVNLYKQSKLKGSKFGKLIKIPKENLIDYILESTEK